MHQKLLFAFILIFILTNCKQNKQPPTKKIIKQSTQLPAKQKSKVIVEKKTDALKLTNKNIISFLTNYGKHNPENKVIIKTDYGNIILKLYKKTPLHRANFIRLVKSGFYNNTLFYRIVSGFIIQGGDSDEPDRKQLKNKAGKYTIPSEFNPNFFHKKGALAMTRSYKNNPNKRSSPFDFYIVQGEKYNNFQLDAFENEYNIKISQYKRSIYKKYGGAPHLDGEHTVFGEVISGFETIDKIASVKVDRSDWPVKDVYIKSIEILN
ncbi:MAG: peptidylprolyl isomerase [Chlorobi bacterium]|nr:peptidylprolyl isomerase [Chlorobiota bacterium]